MKSIVAKAKAAFLAATMFEAMSGLVGAPTAAAPAGPLKTIVSVDTSAIGTAPSNTTVKYTPPCGGPDINAMWQSVTSRPDTPVVPAGTFSNLYARCPVALTGTQTWTFLLVKNGVDTSLSVTIDSTGQFKFDNTHTVTVAAGDTICFKSSPTNTPAAQTNVQIACLFTATSGQVGPLFTAWAGSAAGTGYGTPGNINSSLQAESSRRGKMPTSGTITKLYVNTNTAPGTGNTRSVTLMKNGVDVLTATIADTNTAVNVTGNVSFVPGDLIQLRKDASASAASGLTLVGLDWNPTTTGETISLAPSTGNFDSTTTLFQAIGSTAAASEATETNTYSAMPAACTITKMRADVNTAPGTGKSRAFTLRKNGADQAGVITIQDANTSGTSSPNVAFAAGDLADWKQVPTGTPAASNPCSSSFVIVVT